MKTFNQNALVALLATSFVLALSGMAFAATTVNLGTADNFTVLAGSAITNTGPSVINGDLGLSPGTAVTGFGPGTLNGTQHVADGAALQAQNDLTTAYNTAAGQTPVSTVSTELGGTIKVAGVYNSADGTFGITGTLTLDAQGDPNAVFIFKTSSTLITATASNVILINGAQACNVFWQVGSSATLGTDSTFKGNILALTSITFTTGANAEGRVLARNGAVTLDTNTITKATCASSSQTSGSLSGTVAASSTGALSGTVVATSSTGSLSGTVVLPAAVAVAPSSGGGSNGPPVANAGGGGGPINVATPVASGTEGSVLGASTNIPNIPNTGAGGNALETLLTLLLSAVIAFGGFTYLRYRLR